jgi:hypothetical protein
MNLFKIGRRLSLLLCLALPLGGCNEKDADLFYQSIPYIESVRIYKGPTTFAEVDVERLKPILERTSHGKANPVFKGSYTSRVFLQDGTNLKITMNILDSSFKVEGIKGFFILDGEHKSDGTLMGDVALWRELVDEAWEERRTEMEMPADLIRDLNATNTDRMKRKVN